MRALVTGASRGIGAAIMSELTRWGHDTFTWCRSNGFDLSTQDGIASAVRHTGDIDILVHNCGGGGRYGTDAEVMNKNLHALIAFVDHALPHMSKTGWGRIIAIGSIHGREFGSRPIFMAAKAAQIAYIKGCSKHAEYVRRGITFNVVAPGNVAVEGKPRPYDDLESLPMGRMGKPDEVAKLVVFLCSNYAAWINGSTITIDGGESYAI